MTGHNQYLSNKYSEILLEKLREQESLKNLSQQDMDLIHSTLSSFFGSLPDEERIQKAMMKIIEGIGKNQGDD